MTAVGAPARNRIAYQAPARHHGQHGRVIEAIARQLGCQPCTVRDYISGHHQLGPLVAAIVAGLKAAGEDARAERILAPIRAAMNGIAHPELTTSLLLQERTADGDESTSLVRFIRDPSATHRRALVRDLDVEITIKTELRQALAAEELV